MEARELTWRRSSRSSGNGGNCVEVAALPDQVLVRDSKDPHGPTLTVPPADWRSFLADLLPAPLSALPAWDRRVRQVRTG
jgi:hypothetical protein